MWILFPTIVAWLAWLAWLAGIVGATVYLWFKHNGHVMVGGDLVGASAGRALGVILMAPLVY